MPSVNKVILIGNLTREPDVRQTTNGGMMASFTLAMNRKYVNARMEQVEETTFVDVTVYQKLAEVVQRFVHKGDPLFVEGRLRLDTWDDKATGAKRSKLNVVCESLQLLVRRSDGDSQGQGAPYGARPASARPSYGNPAPQYAPVAAQQPQYSAPQQPATGYGAQPAAPAPTQYRSAAPMPSFQSNPPEEPSSQQDAPVDDIPF